MEEQVQTPPVGRGAKLFLDPETHDLEKRSTRNVGINLTAKAIRFVLQMGSTIILARILTPEDFGLIAMVTVLVNFVGLFKEAGLAQATVQQEKITHEQISTLYWINVGLCFVLGLIVLASAPLIVWIYGEPRLLGLSMALAVPIMISGFGLQHRALLQRHMKFVSLVKIDLIAYAIGITAGITSALNGLGYWSLVVMTLTTSTANILGLTISSGWKPTKPSRKTGVRKMLRFGANLTGFQFVNYFSRNADNFLIGKFIGAAALGQYNKAYGLMKLPLGQLNAPITSALLPALARLRSNPVAFEKLYSKWAMRVAWVTSLPIASATIWGSDIVELLLGPQWIEAGTIFEYLAIGLAFQTLANLTGVLFMSSNKTRQMLRWGIFSSSIIVTAICIGLPWGASGVAISYSCALIPLSILVVSYSNRVCGINSLRYFSRVKYPITISSSIILLGIFCT